MLTLYTFVPFRFGRFSGIVHLYYLFGIVFYAVYIFELIASRQTYLFWLSGI